MENYKFEDVIDIAKHAKCASCHTFVYTLPCEIGVDFGDFLLSVGNLTYPLKKVKMVRMKNESLSVTSRVGTRWLEVKFIKDRETIKPMLEIGLAAYVSEKNDINIEM